MRSGATLLLGLALSAPAQAQPPAGIKGGKPLPDQEFAEKIADRDVPAAFDQIVRDLSSRDFVVRHAASARLTANEQFTLEMLETALKRQDLTLEARTRLGSAARQRFFRAPRAALGFQFGLQLRDRVVVGKTFPQFPSARLLEEGDMILRADGLKLDGPMAQTIIKSVIVSHDPGDAITLVLRRGAQKMELSVPLGRFSDLEGGQIVPDDILARAWRVRLQSRVGAVGGEPIAIPGAPEAPWGRTDEAALRRAQGIMLREANEPAVQLAGGGMPRGAHLPDDDRLDMFFRTQWVRVNGRPQMMPVFRPDWDMDSGRQPLTPEKELAGLLETERNCQQRLGDDDPETLPLTDPRRTELKELKKTLGVIRKQKEAIMAEMDDARAASPARPGKPAADADPKATP